MACTILRVWSASARASRFFALWFMQVLFIGCGQGKQPASHVNGSQGAEKANHSRGKSDVVARVDDIAITRGMVAARLKSTHKTKRQALRELIDEQVLLRHAKDLQLSKSSSFRTRLRALAVRSLLKKDIEAQSQTSSAPVEASKDDMRVERMRALVLAAQEAARTFSIARNTDNFKLLERIDIENRDPL